MAADIQAIRDNSRLLAELERPDSLAGQRRLLEQWFKDAAGQQLEGSIETTQATTESGSHTFQYRGSTSEERAQGLRLAIVQIRAEIAAETAGVDPPLVAGALIPRFRL